jgi:hypothetical protein
VLVVQLRADVAGAKLDASGSDSELAGTIEQSTTRVAAAEHRLDCISNLLIEVYSEGRIPAPGDVPALLARCPTALGTRP